ncbi:unnamed protein product [Sphagnum tenellum]
MGLASLHQPSICASFKGFSSSLILAGARIGSYVGIVTDIPMPGQLVELNKQAWLLLTHYNVSQLHRLHVGAMCRGEGAAAWCLFSVTWACCSFL